MISKVLWKSCRVVAACYNDCMKRLSELAVGCSAEIVAVHATGEIRRRLIGMGVVKGTKLKLERVAPLGDPLELYCKGFHLSLRKSEAEQIMVREV